MPSFYIRWPEGFDRFFEQSRLAGDERYVGVTTDAATEAATDPHRLVQKVDDDRLRVLGYSPTAEAVLVVSTKRTAWTGVNGEWDGTKAIRATPAEEAVYRGAATPPAAEGM